MKIKICCVVEIDLPVTTEDNKQVDALIQQKLDSCVATSNSNRWDITLYRADSLLHVVQELVCDVESLEPAEARAAWYDVWVTGQSARAALEKYGLPISKTTLQ